ncbi:MAG: VRR-NUC domain-containing protein [Gammaproteobacteria bacterium]|nr:VRR-NUC domain-containing protein [Gammaproteobacteria bacterium]
MSGIGGVSTAMPRERQRTLLTPLKPPPPHYYAGNLLKVVMHVQELYSDLLTDEERAWGERLAAASEAAQRLFARIVTRKGPLVRVDALDYAEVPARDAALDELATGCLIERCPAAPAEEVLRLLRVDELCAVFADLPRASKAQRMEHVLCNHAEEEVLERVGEQAPWLGLATPELLGLHQLLFFGSPHQDLTTFVLRDLGVHRYAEVSITRANRQFPDREALQRTLALQELSALVHELGPRPAPELARPVLEALWLPNDDRALERRRSRILNHLGRGLERVGEFDLALACYTRSSLPPGRERRTRILKRLSDERAVAGMKRAILDAPRSALERDFAHRFGCFSPRPAPYFDMELPPDFAPASASVEQIALALLTAEGGVGWHTENHLPMALFALAYWGWIFAPVPGAFTNPFQTGPRDLFWPDFFAARRESCEDPLASPLKPRLVQVERQARGIANRLFGWRRFPTEAAAAVFEAMPEDDIRALLRIVTDDLDQARSGFPDLTLVHADGSYEFVEVKGPGDRLQVNQHLWIAALEREGLPVRVLRLRHAGATNG